MKSLTTLLTLITTASIAQAASTVHSATTLLSTSQNGDGSVIIDLTAGSASADGNPTSTPITLGDGTVEEYLFFNADGVSDTNAGSMNVYASSGTSISNPTFPAGSLSGNKSNVALTLPDGSTMFTTNTGGNGSDLSGTIQTSGYSSGTVYFIFGTSADYAQVDFDGVASGFIGSEDSGDAFVTTGTAFDFSGTSLGSNGTAIAAFTFDNDADSFADTLLDYRVINTDYDGSRAKVYGFVLDGVAVPEPSSSALVCLGLSMAALKRRRK
ncbi:MAG: PEP-CTERM sorting domain-containing protein [Luteolibacter sp.]